MKTKILLVGVCLLWITNREVLRWQEYNLKAIRTEAEIRIQIYDRVGRLVVPSPTPAVYENL